VNWRSIVRKNGENYTNPLTASVHGSRGLPLLLETIDVLARLLNGDHPGNGTA
jgi:hypothetical protein